MSEDKMGRELKNQAGPIDLYEEKDTLYVSICESNDFPKANIWKDFLA